MTLSQYERSKQNKESTTSEVSEYDLYDDEYIALYEAYKLQTLADMGYTLDDILGLVVQYALDNSALETLLEDPAQIIYDWEREEEIYPTYEEWLDDIISEEDEEDVEEEQPEVIDRHDLYHMEWADYESDNPFFAY
jgi:hypothetical protein